MCLVPFLTSHRLIKLLFSLHKNTANCCSSRSFLKRPFRTLCVCANPFFVSHFSFLFFFRLKWTFIAVMLFLHLYRIWIFYDIPPPHFMFLHPSFHLLFFSSAADALSPSWDPFESFRQSDFSYLDPFSILKNIVGRPLFKGSQGTRRVQKSNIVMWWWWWLIGSENGFYVN